MYVYASTHVIAVFLKTPDGVDGPLRGARAEVQYLPALIRERYC